MLFIWFNVIHAVALIIVSKVTAVTFRHTDLNSDLRSGVVVKRLLLLRNLWSRLQAIKRQACLYWWTGAVNNLRLHYMPDTLWLSDGNRSMDSQSNQQMCSSIQSVWSRGYLSDREAWFGLFYVWQHHHRNGWISFSLLWGWIQTSFWSIASSNLSLGKQTDIPAHFTGIWGPHCGELSL